MSLTNALAQILPLGRARITSPFYRLEDGPLIPNDPNGRRFWLAGDVHGAIDFIYADGNLNATNNGHPPVHSPVSGTVVRVGGSENSVYIQDDHGFIHVFRHFNPSFDANGEIIPVVSEGQRVAVGDHIGDMGTYSGGRLGAVSLHVHYEIMLPGSNPFDITTFHFIDPTVYWTPGLNPFAGTISGPDGETAKLNTTGLLVTSTPNRDLGVDVDGDGTLDQAQPFVKEEEWSGLSFEINTPHTQDIILRVSFDSADGIVPALEFQNADRVETQGSRLIAYVKLPATANQSTPNTAAHLILQGADDGNAVSEALRYSVEAGFYQSGTGPFVSYNSISGSNVFTNLFDRTLIVLDNDTRPTPTVFDQRSENAAPTDDDLIFSSDTSKFVDAGAGNDLVSTNAGADVLIGGIGNNYRAGLPPIRHHLHWLSFARAA